MDDGVSAAAITSEVSDALNEVSLSDTYSAAKDRAAKPDLLPDNQNNTKATETTNN